MSIYVIELILIGAFILFILVKPDSLHDSFFKSKRYLNKDNLFGIIADLEKINNQNYDGMKHHAERYFADNKITDWEYDKIETHLTRMYFKNYEKRFFPFVRSHWSLKIVYLSMLVFSFYYFNIGIAEVASHNDVPPNQIIWWQLGLSVAGCIIPIAFWFIKLGFLSIFLTVFTMVFKNKGSILRAQLTLDELIRFLKPGGRSTPIYLGPNDMNDRIFPL